MVTNGLVLHLDAGNSRSYPGSGTTWSDLSKNNNTATLINTPTFSTANNGILTFSRTSLQYGETSTSLANTPNWTAEAWVKFTTTPASNLTVSALVTNAFNGSNLNFAITTHVGLGTADKGIYAAFYNGAWRYAPPHVSSAGVWYQYCGTYDGASIKLYVNGNLFSSAAYVGTAASGGAVRIARRWDFPEAAGNMIDGAIPIVRVYNRTLTASEILQNFNATKGRFGL